MKRMVHDGTRCSYKDAFSLCVRGDCRVSATSVATAQGLRVLGLLGGIAEVKHAKCWNSTCRRAGSQQMSAYPSLCQQFSDLVWLKSPGELGGCT